MFGGMSLVYYVKKAFFVTFIIPFSTFTWADSLTVDLSNKPGTDYFEIANLLTVSLLSFLGQLIILSLLAGCCDRCRVDSWRNQEVDSHDANLLEELDDDENVNNHRQSVERSWADNEVRDMHNIQAFNLTKRYQTANGPLLAVN